MTVSAALKIKRMCLQTHHTHTHLQLCRLSLTCCDGIAWLCVEADAALTFLHAKPWLCLCLQSTPCVQISCHRLLLAAEGHLPRTGCFLGPSSVELDLIHRPHGPFYIFQPYETFVEAQVVPDCILITTKKGEMKYKFCLDIEPREDDFMKIHLPGGCIAPEIGKVSREPVVDFV